MTKSQVKNIRAAKVAFADEYLGLRGLYSIGIGRHGDELGLVASGTATALKRLPESYQGIPVWQRPGSRARVALAGV